MKVNSKCHNQIVSPTSISLSVSPLLVEGCLENHSYLPSSFLYGYHNKIQWFVFVFNMIQKRKQYLSKKERKAENTI